VTDIVERLRGNYASPHHGGCQNCYGTVMDDAADEIERLRRRVVVLEMIIRQDLHPDDCSDDANRMIVEAIDARPALSPSHQPVTKADQP
jgi:hypothetical protein